PGVRDVEPSPRLVRPPVCASPPGSRPGNSSVLPSFGPAYSFCAACTCGAVRQVVGSCPAVHWIIEGSNLHWRGSLRNRSDARQTYLPAHRTSMALVRGGKM